MIPRFRFILIVGLIFIVTVSAAKADEYYFRFTIDSRAELGKLTSLISIDNVKGDTVYAYANDSEYANFKTLGYTYEILPAPGSLYKPLMSDDQNLLLDWDYYPTYSAYLTLMSTFEANYPNLCRIENIGYTVDGRQLLFAKLSANVDIEEAEPELMYSSSMHGDETTGYILMLHLIDYLLSNYGTDPQATALLDNTEIWINPLANPDGTYHAGDNTVQGATRGNANGVDLNRNFPDPQDGPHPDGYSWQPETVAMINFFGHHNFVISANFHGGVEVVNYPWDTWPQLHADNNWYVSISRQYADSAQNNSPSGYMDDLNNGITNGYDWYEVNGGRQDCLNYWYGCREVTIELSHTKLLPEYQLIAHWNYNRAALLTYLEHAYYGVRGIVTSSETSFPLAATISVLNHDIDSTEVYTDPDFGDYYRMLSPGTYSFRFTSLGYVPQTINNVVVTSGGVTELNVQLVPLSDDPILEYQSNTAGVVDAGDTVSMAITLVNNGGGEAVGVNGVLSTTDNYVTIIQGASSYPTIPALGGTGTSNTDYSFAVSSSCPAGHQARFRLDLTESGGYADSVFFNIVIGLQIEDFETGNFSNYDWQFEGIAPWFVDMGDTYEGAYSARSGDIADNQNSVLTLTYEVFNQDSISFYYKVSSESGYDYLKFYIDNEVMGQWSGSIDWRRTVYPVGPGQHSFNWEYDKDYSVSHGSDCGWIDFIIFPSSSAPLQIVTPSLPDWTVGVAYSQQLEAEGGEGLRTWTDLNNDLYGSGLTLSSSGLMQGTPSSAGVISFTAHVEDAVGGYDNRQYEFTVNPVLVITTDSLPDWTAGYACSQQLEISGGTGNKTWSDLNDDLSGTGLSLSTSGLLSGTPSSSGTVSFTAHVEDAVGATAQSQFEFIINDELIIVTSSLPDWTVGQPYSQQLEALGGTGELTWSDLNGDLADFGLTVSDAGLIVGTPILAGQVSFTVRVEDAVGATDDLALAFALNDMVEITTDSLPMAIVGEPYSYQLQATGGTGELIWVDRDDNLHGTGLTLSSSGQISGTPSSAIPITLVAVATDQVGSSDEQWLTLSFESLFIPGDANGDGRVIGSDVTYLVGYFRGINPAPDPFLAGDANGDCQIIGSDVTYLVNYFRGIGDPPVMGDCITLMRKSGGK